MNRKIIKNWDKLWWKNSKIKKTFFKTITTTLSRHRTITSITLNSSSKKRIKTKNSKVKKEYLILQERNKRLLKLIKNDEIETLLTRRCKITKIDENFLAKILKLKRQRSTIDLKSTNLNIYNNKSFKKFKNWTRNVFNIFEINFFYFFLKWIKIN